MEGFLIVEHMDCSPASQGSVAKSDRINGLLREKVAFVVDPKAPFK